MMTKKFKRAYVALKSAGKALIMPNDQAGVKDIDEMIKLTILVLVFVSLIVVIAQRTTDAASDGNLSVASQALIVLIPLILVAALLQTFLGKKGKGR